MSAAAAIDRRLRKNPEQPADGVETDARDVAKIVARYWGDLSVNVLTRALEISQEDAQR